MEVPLYYGLSRAVSTAYCSSSSEDLINDVNDKNEKKAITLE